VVGVLSESAGRGAGSKASLPALAGV